MLERISEGNDCADVSRVRPQPLGISRGGSSSLASHYVEQIKTFVRNHDVSADELLEKLDQLSNLLQDEALTRTTSSNSADDNLWKRSRIRHAGYRANVPVQASTSSLFGSISSRKTRDGSNTSSQRQQIELSSGSDSDDQDDSFARLSYLLEKSIHEGQDALASPTSSQRTSHATPRVVRASSFAGSPLRPPSLTTTSARFFQSSILPADDNGPAIYQVDGQPTGIVSEASDADNSDEMSNVISEDPQQRHVPPPAYAETRNAPGRRSLINTPQSLVDDGIAALESLIDQLSVNSLSNRTPSGLTSNNLLVVVSFLVLVVAYFAANQYGTIGVNCHCTCPDLTLSK